MEHNKIDLEEIRKLIPHREPFLYIDELSILKNYKAMALKNSLMQNFF